MTLHHKLGSMRLGGAVLGLLCFSTSCTSNTAREPSARERVGSLPQVAEEQGVGFHWQLSDRQDDLWLTLGIRVSADDPEDTWIQGCEITVYNDDDGDHAFDGTDEVLRTYSASLDDPTSAIVFGPSSMSREASSPRVTAAVLTKKGEVVHDWALTEAKSHKSSDLNGG